MKEEQLTTQEYRQKIHDALVETAEGRYLGLNEVLNELNLPDTGLELQMTIKQDPEMLTWHTEITIQETEDKDEC